MLYILDIIYCGLRHAPYFRNEENIINVTLPFVHNRLLESNRSLRVQLDHQRPTELEQIPKG